MSSVFGFGLSDIYSRIIPGAISTVIIAGPYLLWRYDQLGNIIPEYIISDLTVVVPTLLLIWFGLGEAIRYFRRTIGGVPQEFREQYQYYHPDTNSIYPTEWLSVKLRLYSWVSPYNISTDQCQFFWHDIANRFNLNMRNSGPKQVYKILKKDLSGDLSADTKRNKSLYELSRNVRMSMIMSYLGCTFLTFHYYITNSRLFIYAVLWLSVTISVAIFMLYIYRSVFVGLESTYVNDLLTEYYVKYGRD